jgi:secondary thiamine-phosphate synthase enzyme
VETLEVSTTTRTELVDISGEVAAAVARTGITEGMAYVYCPHTTAAITINENADPTVKSDFLNHLAHLVPVRSEFRHAEGNSDAHIKSILTGACQPVPVNDGKLVLGTWQGVFFCEYDGPRRRRVHVKVMKG